LKINLIIERLSTYFKVDTNTALAQKLGVSATTLSNWKSRNTIDYELIFTKCEGIDLNWLLLGKGKMHQSNYDYSDKNSPPGVAEDPLSYKEIIRAKDETIDTQKKYIGLLEDELKKVKKEEPGDVGQKRKVG
jgi:hypothetical protein